MSLKDTINNTNTQKENTKKVATQIDNKLVELGGEQAENLSDVANKIEGMVGQYRKIAIMQSSQTIDIEKTEDEYTYKKYKVNTNYSFKPERIIVKMDIYHTRYLSQITYNVVVDSRCHFDEHNYLGLELSGTTYNMEHIYIENKQKTGFDLCVSAAMSNFEIKIKEITVLN